MTAELPELDTYRAEFFNEAGNPSDVEVEYLYAVSKEDAMRQVEEYIKNHPFEVILLSLEKLDA